MTISSTVISVGSLVISKEAVGSACAHACADEQRKNEQQTASVVVCRGGAAGRALGREDRTPIIGISACP